MIGSPARLIQRVPLRVFSSISRLAKGALASRVRPRALFPPSVAGSEWPISWLAEQLAERGQALEPGQVVLPGACTRAVPVTAGDTVTGEVDGLGAVSVRFA